MRNAVEIARRCTGLRHVVFLGTGARSYMDPEALASIGIEVHLIRGYGDTAVAECAIGLLFAAARSFAAMDRAMRLPFKVSTTTSNFMIGVTAAASAGGYLHRGYIEPTIAFPVMLGVLAGALLGARVLARANVKWLRILFTAVVVVMELESEQ